MPFSPTILVASIVMHDGKVLIGRETSGKWEMPVESIHPFEGLRETALRSSFELAGLTTNPQNVMFVAEDINKEANHHDVAAFIYNTFVEGEIKPAGRWSEARWVDVRELGQYQEGMSELAIDGFYKFSMVLHQSAARSGAQA
jgi:ADP-ribose pyrophosphatase YjhB (NUDIX family)